MNSSKQTSTIPTDAQLHKLAHKRVEFRKHLLVYCIINVILWTLWYLTGHGYIWPLWPTMGWGVGLIFHYLFEYRSFRFLSETEQYKKLKKEIKQFNS